MDVSDIFFSARGRGRGSERRREGGAIFMENPRRGGLPGGWGWGARGREVVCGELGGGGGLNFFFPPKCPPSYPCYMYRRSLKNLEKVVGIPGGDNCIKSCHVSGDRGFFSLPTCTESGQLCARLRKQSLVWPALIGSMGLDTYGENEGESQ